ncbi:hypothetical protein AAGW05_14495 [Arthrobacter sp. LAPM80]|uniref:hypothetical protein n=1 Tax=Arthrobacter sp. LAPM80 TaxID=3141788 RepID=UPI00398AD942
MSWQKQAAGSTGDPAVDALIAQAAQAAQLPASEHKDHYTHVLQGLERELDADPSAAMQSAAMHTAPTPAAQNQGATS